MTSQFEKPSSVLDSKVHDWDMQLGEEDSRTRIHSRHGGSTARGISAPARSSGRRNILLWWKPGHGDVYGYVDGWTRSADAFYFTGTGQVGDQFFTVPLQENGRLRDHEQTGDHVRLLRYKGKNRVEYVSELRLDPQRPWVWFDGLDGEGQIRQVIQFRLLPVGESITFAIDAVRDEPPIELEETDLDAGPEKASFEDLEGLKSPHFKMLLSAREAVAQRRESRLVHAFAAWILGGHGKVCRGLKIPHADGSTILRADAFIPELNLLVEAKSSASREALRLAIGQLLDYARWIEPRPRLAILVPHQPADDMLELMAGLDIVCIWKSNGGFHVSGPLIAT